MLSPEEIERYRRQIEIKGFGQAGQEKLKRTRVFIAGVGGLGSPAALYLAAAGFGSLRIVDPEPVELSNLNRQLLHWTRDTGRQKVDSAGEKIRELNPEIKVETLCERIAADNYRDLISGCDLIVDALDNLEARYLLNQAAVENRVPLFHGAVCGFEGRALTVLPGQSACLMCLYRGVQPLEKAPVLGTTPAVIACIEVTEAVKYVTGLGRLLAGRLLIYDGLNLKFTEVQVARDEGCAVCRGR